MHINPRHAGLHGIHYTLLRQQYSLVHVSLFISEFAVDRVGTCNVGAIAVIFSAHVIQHQLARFELVHVRFT